jgi:hypothetical protein
MNKHQSVDEDPHAKFLKLERDLNVFNISSNDIPIWERIRFNLYSKIKKESLNTGQAHTSASFDSKAYLKGIQLWVRNAIIKNPLFTNQHDFLFYGHSRRKLGEDNNWWDLYCDPITTIRELDYLHIEKPYLMDHKSPAKTENLRYLDFIWYTGAIRRNLGLSDVSLSESKKDELTKVSRVIKERFGVDVDLVRRAEAKLTRRDSTIDLYKQFLRRVDPAVVIVVVSYGKHTFLEACHDLNIPTVELQHGVIHPDHMGYSFPEFRSKKTFPDYLFVWGDFWKNQVEFPIPDERVRIVGYPYLEQTVQRYEDVQSKKQLLFISQGTIGEQLSKFALKVDQHPDIDYNVVYKLHPGEYDRWQEEYPWLVGADLKVIDSPEPPLYRLFAESSTQIGVGSTAVYEGLCFDLETYVFGCQESKTLQPLIDCGAATEIQSVDQLSVNLGSQKTLFDREHYFLSNAVDNIHEELHSICDQRE